MAKKMNINRSNDSMSRNHLPMQCSFSRATHNATEITNAARVLAPCKLHFVIEPNIGKGRHDIGWVQSHTWDVMGMPTIQTKHKIKAIAMMADQGHNISQADAVPHTRNGSRGTMLLAIGMDGGAQRPLTGYKQPQIAALVRPPQINASPDVSPNSYCLQISSLQGVKTRRNFS
jgi:hypothetical protein